MAAAFPPGNALSPPPPCSGLLFREGEEPFRDVVALNVVGVVADVGDVVASIPSLIISLPRI